MMSAMYVFCFLNFACLFRPSFGPVQNVEVKVNVARDGLFTSPKASRNRSF
jgi:hypothetical protein